MEVFKLLAALIVCSGMLHILLPRLFRVTVEVKGMSLWTWKPSPDGMSGWKIDLITGVHKNLSENIKLSPAAIDILPARML